MSKEKKAPIEPGRIWDFTKLRVKDCIGIGTIDPKSGLEICSSNYVGLSLDGNTIRSMGSCPGKGPMPIGVDLNLKSAGPYANVVLETSEEGGVSIRGGRRIYLRSNLESPDRNKNFNPKLFYEGMISGDGDGTGNTLGWGLHLNALPWTWGQDALYYHGGTHRFYTTSGDGAESEKVRITSDGNVGIGTPEPQQKLHVAGDYMTVQGKGDEQAYIGGDGVAADVEVGSFNPNIRKVSLWNRATGDFMSLKAKDGEFSNITAAEINGGTPWTSANDGANSGLDADKLDGRDISELVPYQIYVHIDPKTITGNNKSLQVIGTLNLNLPTNMYCHFRASGDVHVPNGKKRSEFWVAISDNPGIVPGATYYRYSLRYYRLHDITKEKSTEALVEPFEHHHDVQLELYEMGYVGTDYQMYLSKGKHTLYWVIYLWASGTKIQIGETGTNRGGSTFSVICIPTGVKGEISKAVKVKMVE